MRNFLCSVLTAKGLKNISFDALRAEMAEVWAAKITGGQVLNTWENIGCNFWVKC